MNTISKSLALASLCALSLAANAQSAEVLDRKAVALQCEGACTVMAIPIVDRTSEAQADDIKVAKAACADNKLFPVAIIKVADRPYGKTGRRDYVVLCGDQTVKSK